VDPATTLVFLESDAGWNASRGATLLPQQPRHDGVDNYGMADGHVNPVPRAFTGPDEHGHKRWRLEPESDRTGRDAFLSPR
jgi:prepilin-type processing-associated H-X9-DG protein